MSTSIRYLVFDIESIADAPWLEQKAAQLPAYQRYLDCWGDWSNPGSEASQAARRGLPDRRTRRPWKTCRFSGFGNTGNGTSEVLRWVFGRRSNMNGASSFIHRMGSA